MNLSPSQRIAVGVDFEPRGNERRLQFAWPVVFLAEDRLEVAEGGEPSAPTSAALATEIAPNVEIFASPILVLSGEGILVVGPAYLKDAAALGDPEIDRLIGWIERTADDPSPEKHGTRLQGSEFACVGSTYAAYEGTAFAIARRAREIFDRLLTAKSTSEEDLLRPLRLFDAEPVLDYEDRVTRRLIYLDIVGDANGYSTALSIGSRRLGITATELEQRTRTAYRILRFSEIRRHFRRGGEHRYGSPSSSVPDPDMNFDPSHLAENPIVLSSGPRLPLKEAIHVLANDFQASVANINWDDRPRSTVAAPSEPAEAIDIDEEVQYA